MSRDVADSVRRIRNSSKTDWSDTMFVGDSIMEGASPYLAELFPNADIDAAYSRSLEYGGTQEGYAEDRGVLDVLRADGGSHAVYIIGTGNNDEFGMDIEDVEQIVKLCGDDAKIYLVTEYVRSFPEGTENTNASIRYAVENYGNVHMIDWHALITEHEDDWLQGDICHPQTDDGWRGYAELVYDSVCSMY